MTAQDILKAASFLPEAERVELIEGLLATFDAGPSAANVAAAWRKLAGERAAELDSGSVRTVPWEEVRQEGERRIHGRSSP